MQKTVSLTVNGKPETATVEGRTLLVQLLREILGLTGTHVGCDTSQCGACVVHVDGESVKSCTLLAVQAEGANVMTIEGVARRRQAAPDAGSLPRESRAAMRLLHARHGDERGRPGARTTRAPTEREIREWLEGNICRCTGYHNIVKAIKAGGGDARRGAACQPPRSGGGVAAMTAIGTPLLRREDYRFLTGQGNYTDDINRPGQLHAFMLQQPARPCPLGRNRHGRGEGRAGRRRRLYRRRPGGGRDRRPALRLGDQFQGRLADEGAAASGAGRSAGCAMSATRSPSSSPRASPRRAMRPS